MTKQTCTHCNNNWDYKGKAKKKATCPDCGDKTPIVMIAILVLFAISFAPFIAAETFTVEIPHEIGEQECQTFRDILNIPFTQCYIQGIGPVDENNEPVIILDEEGNPVTEIDEIIEDTPVIVDIPVVINDDTLTVTIGVSGDDEEFFGDHVN